MPEFWRKRLDLKIQCRLTFSKSESYVNIFPEAFSCQNYIAGVLLCHHHYSYECWEKARSMILDYARSENGYLKYEDEDFTLEMRIYRK